MCRQVVTLIDDEVAVVGHAIVDDTLPGQTLNESDVDLSGWLVPPSPNSTDRFRWNAEEGRQPTEEDGSSGFNRPGSLPGSKRPLLRNQGKVLLLQLEQDADLLAKR